MMECKKSTIVLCIAYFIHLTRAAIEDGKFYAIQSDYPNRNPKANRAARILSFDVDDVDLQLPVSVESTNMNNVYGDYGWDNNAVKNNNGLGVSREFDQQVQRISAKLYAPDVAVLIEDDEQATRNAAKYMKYIMQRTRNNFWLMKYNASGVSDVLTTSKQNTASSFYQRILGDASITRQSLGSEGHSAAIFFSVIKASYILPGRSQIMLFAQSHVEDDDLANTARQQCERKGINMIVLWQGDYPSVHKDELLIRQVAEVINRQEDNFFVANTEREQNREMDYINVTKASNPVITHLSNVHGHNEVRVPIEDGVRAIHVSLTNTVNEASLITPHPQGYSIDLLNSAAVQRFAPDSFTLRTGETIECELALSGGVATPTRRRTGVWKLVTNAYAHYNVVVSVRHDLVVESNVVLAGNADANGNDNGKTGKPRLLLNIVGDYKQIDNITLTTAGGEPISNNQWHVNQIKDNVQSGAEDIETFKPGSRIDIDFDRLPEQQMHIQVHGKDRNGNDFQRITYYDPILIHNKLEPTTVKLVQGSELLQTPGRAANILYEVTNNRDNVVLMQFQARDERGYLRRLSHLWSWINPRQKIIVTLTTISRGGSDRVTFYAFSGSDRVAKAAIIRTDPGGGAGAGGRSYDDESPHMWHKFTSNCLDVLLGRCESHSWTVEVTAQDRETGLLLVTSSPEGLYFPQGYVSGTTEEVTGVLSGSCCHSSIVLTAFDANNNQRSYVADAYWAPLGAAAISAIVIAIVVVILIILLIVYCCIWGMCRKREDEMEVKQPDLPEVQLRYKRQRNTDSVF